MNRALEAFSEDLSEAIDESLDWKDFVSCFLPNAITVNQPWQLGDEKEIRTAIDMAIRESSNKILKQGMIGVMVDMIWEHIEWERPLTVPNLTTALAS
jgi:hypothetical protein